MWYSNSLLSKTGGPPNWVSSGWLSKALFMWFSKWFNTFHVLFNTFYCDRSFWGMCGFVQLADWGEQGDFHTGMSRLILACTHRKGSLFWDWPSYFPLAIKNSCFLAWSDSQCLQPHEWPMRLKHEAWGQVSHFSLKIELRLYMSGWTQWQLWWALFICKVIMWPGPKKTHWFLD